MLYDSLENLFQNERSERNTGLDRLSARHLNRLGIAMDIRLVLQAVLQLDRAEAGAESGCIVDTCCLRISGRDETCCIASRCRCQDCWHWLRIIYLCGKGEYLCIILEHRVRKLGQVTIERASR